MERAHSGLPPAVAKLGHSEFVDGVDGHTNLARAPGYATDGVSHVKSADQEPSSRGGRKVGALMPPTPVGTDDC